MVNQKFDSFASVLKTLKEKWREVPGTTQKRIFSSELLKLTDSEFLDYWMMLFDNNCSGAGYSTRGWYHDLYKSLALQGGDWLEVGSGLGFDGVFFAEHGANVTFVDIVSENLEAVERLCAIKRIKNVGFVVMEDLDTISELEHFDVVMAIGSLINAPYSMMSEERRMLASHLKIGGRWLELCYPKERWEREGRLEFEDWGKKTDGENTPWVEWYDEQKLLNALEPHTFDTILARNFHDNDFNWFDFIKRE